jgi:hypothetical protein
VPLIVLVHFFTLTVVVMVEILHRRIWTVRRSKTDQNFKKFEGPTYISPVSACIGIKGFLLVYHHHVPSNPSHSLIDLNHAFHTNYSQCSPSRCCGQSPSPNVRNLRHYHFFRTTDILRSYIGQLLIQPGLNSGTTPFFQSFQHI